MKTILKYFRNVAVLFLMHMTIPQTVLHAQEVVYRSAAHDSRSDVAVRGFKSVLTSELGVAQVDTTFNPYVAVSAGFNVKRLTLGVEVETAQKSSYVSQVSAGGSVGWNFDAGLYAAGRVIQYRNADLSNQTLAMASVDRSGKVLSVGASVGHLTFVGLTSQARVTVNLPRVKFFAYSSDNMEIPDVPWSVWTVRETGLTTRVVVSQKLNVFAGYASGKNDRTDYRSVTFGLRVLGDH
jgi:hypothetical protein